MEVLDTDLLLESPEDLTLVVVGGPHLAGLVTEGHVTHPAQVAPVHPRPALKAHWGRQVGRTVGDGRVYQYELHGLDIPGGHQTSPGPCPPLHSEWEAVVLVLVDQEVVTAAVEDQLTVGALVRGRPLTEETGT